MKKIEKDELYQHLSGFFKRKGVVLAEGSYAQTIQKSCALLTDVLNCSHESLKRVKGEIDRRLDKVRKVIHERSAPKGSWGPTPAAGPPPVQEAPPPQAETPKRPRAKKKAPAKKPKNSKP